MMADPMADMGQPGGGAPSDADDNNGKEIFNPLLLQLNLAKIERIRSVMGIAAGCVTGILGCTGLSGIGCFLLSHLCVSVAVWVWNMSFDLKMYTRQSWVQYLSAPVQSLGLSFTLFWTLFYGLVYLY